MNEGGECRDRPCDTLSVPAFHNPWQGKQELPPHADPPDRAFRLQHVSNFTAMLLPGGAKGKRQLDCAGVVTTTYAVCQRLAQRHGQSDLEACRMQVAAGACVGTAHQWACISCPEMMGLEVLGRQHAPGEWGVG